MTLEGFGIRLEILTPESAELVRRWRNQPEILCQMEFQEIISEEQQQQWFQGIQNDSSRYFMILSGERPVGMIHLAEINRSTQAAEAGLFIGDPAFTGTGTALGASLLLLDHAFGDLDLVCVRAKVRNTNMVARQYNQLLGFTEEKELDEHFTQFELTREVYLEKKAMLEKLILP